MAEVGGQLCAALSLADGAVVANPFLRTTELLNLLHARAVQLTGQHVETRTPISVLRQLVGARRRGLAAS